MMSPRKARGGTPAFSWRAGAVGWCAAFQNGGDLPAGAQRENNAEAAIIWCAGWRLPGSPFGMDPVAAEFERMSQPDKVVA